MNEVTGYSNMMRLWAEQVDSAPGCSSAFEGSMKIRLITHSLHVWETERVMPVTLVKSFYAQTHCGAVTDVTQLTVVSCVTAPQCIPAVIPTRLTGGVSHPAEPRSFPSYQQALLFSPGAPAAWNTRTDAGHELQQEELPDWHGGFGNTFAD